MILSGVSSQRAISFFELVGEGLCMPLAWRLLGITNPAIEYQQVL